MAHKYDRPGDIPNNVIRETFDHANSVKFSARANNSVVYRSISFGDLHWWLPLTRVLPIIGITPQMLRPVFNPQHEVKKTKRRHPFLCALAGLGRFKYELVENELPEIILTFDQLGSIVLYKDPKQNTRFAALAGVLNKPVEVLREDGGTGEHRYCFTAYPNGKIDSKKK